MVYELKTPNHDLPGVLVFSHKEYIRFLNTQLASPFLGQLKERYFIGVHWGIKVDEVVDNKYVDFHFSLPGILPEECELTGEIIPLTTRNFIPAQFTNEDSSEKIWDVITVGRKVKMKRYLEFFLIIKKLLEINPNAKILIIAPEDKYRKKSTHDYLFKENYEKIFDKNQKEQIKIYSEIGFLETNKISEMMKQSKTFLFTSIREGVAKVTGEAALCGLKVLVYKNFKGAAKYGIDTQQLYLYSDIQDAAENLALFIEQNTSFHSDNNLLKESFSLEKLQKHLESIYIQKGYKYDYIINSKNLRDNLNSYNQTLPRRLVLGDSNDIRNNCAFLYFCRMTSLDTSIAQGIVAILLDILFFTKEIIRKRKNIVPLFILKTYRKKTQYNKLAF